MSLTLPSRATIQDQSSELPSPKGEGFQNQIACATNSFFFDASLLLARIAFAFRVLDAAPRPLSCKTPLLDNSVPE